MSLISIVVPVYNVEKYIERCLDSLACQTYQDLEVILIDDGSTDKSSSFCQNYSVLNKKFKYFRKKNGGLSSARNLGLKKSNGRYIGFVDSDDWVAEDMYEYLYNLCIVHNADISQVEIVCTSCFPAKVKFQSEKILSFQGKNILQYYMTATTKAYGNYSVGKCLFSREILRDLFFREGKINEDIDFKYVALSRSKKIIVSNQGKYFYFQREGSITGQKLQKRDFDLYDAAFCLYDLCKKEEFGTIRFLAKVKTARTSFSLLSKILYYGIGDKSIDRNKVVKTLQAELRKNLFLLLRSPIDWKRKGLMVLFSLNFNFAVKVFDIYKSFFLKNENCSFGLSSWFWRSGKTNNNACKRTFE